TLSQLRKFQQTWISPRRLSVSLLSTTTSHQSVFNPGIQTYWPRQCLRSCSSNSANNNYGSKDFDSLITATKSTPNQISDEWGDIGEELTGKKLSKEELIPVLNKFLQRQTVRHLAAEHGLKPKL